MNLLYVVGFGPGGYEDMTVRAVRALEKAEVIAGYTVYCALMRPHFPDKDYVATPMMRETERCRLALESAASGRTTALICSGDAGIYGLASPVLELAPGYGVAVAVIPGVTAASAGGALLGAPLTCDFAAISLSDLLTPMEAIEKRLEAAAAADFAVAIYNPSSKKRSDYLRRACEIMLRHRSPETPCGAARNIGRDGAETELMTLGDLRDYAADMFTTLFIGNSTTKIIGGKLVTPRGYAYE